MLRLDIRPGEKIDIDNGRIIVALEAKSGQLARLAFEAAKDIPIRLLDGALSPAQLAREGLRKPE